MELGCVGIDAVLYLHRHHLQKILEIGKVGTMRTYVASVIIIISVSLQGAWPMDSL